MLDPFQFFQEFFVAAVGKLQSQIMVLPQQLQMFLASGSDYIISRSGKIIRDVLREQGDPGIGAFDDLTPIRGNIAIQHFQKGGFARPIPAQQTDPFTFLDPERRTVQEKRSTKAHGNIINPYSCHIKIPLLPCLNIEIAFIRNQRYLPS